MIYSGFEEQWNHLTEEAKGNLPRELHAELEKESDSVLRKSRNGLEVQYPAAFHRNMVKRIQEKNPQAAMRKAEHKPFSSLHDPFDFKLKELLTWQGLTDKDWDGMIARWLREDKTLEQFYHHRMYGKKDAIEAEMQAWKTINNKSIYIA